jgi:hypothetical protein
LRWTGANLVAGFEDGQIVYSDDLAETWTDATEPSSDYWAMASSDGAGTVLLVSTGAAALSSDHGETWTGLTIASFTPRDVAYFDGKFHVWTDANTVYQSEDGASWVGPSNMTFSVPIAGDWDPELLDNVGRCVVVCGQILVGFFAKWTDTSKSQDLFFSRDGIAWTRSGSFRTSYLARLTGATSEYGHHPQRCRLLTSSPQTPAHPSAPWHQLVVVPSAPTFGLPSSYGFADAYMSERDYGGYQQTKTVINASSGATMLVETIADENITLSGLSQTLNGVDVDTDGYYVLAIAQSDPTENGPWIAHSGVWTRPEELDVFTDKLVTVTRGNKFGDTVWICHSGTEVGVDASHWRKLAGKDVQDTVTLSADQTAWAPTGGSFIDWLKVNVAQPVDIHSLDIDANILGSGFTQKQTNVASTYSATFKHDSSSGTATKILCPGGVDFVLAPSETVFFAHDPTLTKIRILGKASEALSLQESTSFDFTLKSSLSGDAQCSIASGVFSWTPTTADAGNQGLAMLALTQRGSIARMERIGAATENMTLKLGPATNHATYLSAPILDALSAFNAGDVTALTLDSGSSVDTTSTQGGDISPDGYHVLDVDDTNNVIRQYYLSTPWKPSTRTLVYEYDTTGVDTGTPTCAKWGPTGERMYWGVAESNSIYQFDCGDTYYMPGGSDSGNSLDVSGEGSTPLDLVISSDESKIVVSLQSNDSVFRYDGTPELIGTFNYASDSLDLATLTGSSLSFHSLHWDSANSILYTTSSEGGSPSHVYRIVLAGVATLTGSTVITTSADLSSDDDRLTGMAVSPDEQYVVVFGRTNSAVLRYVTHALTADVSYRVGFLPQEHNVFESGVTSPVTEGSYTDEFTASWDISGRIPSNCVVKCTVHWCAGTASGAEADDAFDIVAEQTVLATFNGGALLQVQHLRAWASPVYNQAGGDWDDASIQYRVVAAGVFNNETADGVGALTADATGGVLNSYCETNGAGLVASAKLTIDHIMERPSELT